MSLPHPVVSRVAAFVVVASIVLSAEHLWARNRVLTSVGE